MLFLAPQDIVTLVAPTLSSLIHPLLALALLAPFIFDADWPLLSRRYLGPLLVVASLAAVIFVASSRPSFSSLFPTPSSGERGREDRRTEGIVSKRY